ncbi:UdgX family uracil-DNA binding protein [Ramlibacter tataouinensis]|uniref:Type-4 uracil-DNA glycosylase n=1 Tax=Ramlibacter tataouinensis (strain ATCC BAA-407 / DSM 14655 / LMG 21543 / TTB310) TaxID=365046 RepID=F5Y2C4_RAMTT|nr:UdgX family uracil-DNA binding protein [Ramlibacter tataouinensis]AEG91098.1 uracil-DNA glycosylase protein-like protein [Ramlibacter tataouinensis TTB310]
MHAVLASETDLAGFRAEARELLAHQVPPEQVQWETAQAQNADLFSAPPATAAESRPRGVPKAASAIVPASFVRLCELVVLHSDPQRFALMYRLLWRLVHEPGLRNDPIDPDMLSAQQMAQSVRRDLHKMKAFVRFRPVPDEEHPGEVLHVAWFEPMHHIVEAAAPWFAARFANMRWAILTPERCVQWDLQQLHYGPGVGREQAPPPDAGEQLWLTYYQSIFNPARLKLQAMQQHMPRKYWHNLPEAQLIAPLAAQALERSGTMIEQPATQPLRRIPRPVRQDDPAVTLERDGIHSLEELKQATMRCRECPIGEFATQSVTGEGRLQAKLMFVGEQPGDQEDLRGHPFVGPAGQLLDRALAQLGLPRDEIFVSNAVKHFKFELRGKRRIHKSPSQREAAACLHWLEDEIALVRPRALVALGATAARSLMGRMVAVTAERGKWLERPDGRRVLITLHPSALLRMPPEEREAAFEAFVADLAQAREVFQG